MCAIQAAPDSRPLPTRLLEGPAPEMSDRATERFRVVIVEDDPDISRLIEYQLRREGRYDIISTATGEEGLRACTSDTDLVILDLNLPGLDGLEVCRELRAGEETATVPILMLTARVSEQDRIRGLDIGADDYVTKPFSVKELVARVRALLRRTTRGPAEEPVFVQDGLKIELDRMRVTVSGDEIPLTRKEWGLLRLLIDNRGRVLTRETILRQVWGEDFFGVDRTVDVHVRHLRQKLGDAAEPLQTVIGVGYRWRES